MAARDYSLCFAYGTQAERDPESPMAPGRLVSEDADDPGAEKWSEGYVAFK
jgi:hypothetical protein